MEDKVVVTEDGCLCYKYKVEPMSEEELKLRIRTIRWIRIDTFLLGVAIFFWNFGDKYYISGYTIMVSIMLCCVIAFGMMSNWEIGYSVRLKQLQKKTNRELIQSHFTTAVSDANGGR